MVPAQGERLTCHSSCIVCTFVHTVQLNFFQEVQVYTLYTNLLVQSFNSATKLDKCTAKLDELNLFFLIFSTRFKNILEVSTVF